MQYIFSHQYKGLPGNPDNLERLPYKSFNPSKTGLYFLYLNNEIVYIGYSRKSIYHRLRYHRWRGINFDSFAFIRVAPFWEQYFIRAYKPKYNVHFARS